MHPHQLDPVIHKPLVLRRIGHNPHSLILKPIYSRRRRLDLVQIPVCFLELFERTCTVLRNQSKSYVLLLTRSPYSIAVPYSRGGRSEAQQN